MRGLSGLVAAGLALSCGDGDGGGQDASTASDTGTTVGSADDGPTTATDGPTFTSGETNSETNADTTAGPSGPINVASVLPVAQEVAAMRDGGVAVTFTGAVDPASVTAASMGVFGRWSGPAGGSFEFEDGDTVVRFVPDEPFMAAEYVTVTLSTAVQSAGGEPLADGYAWSFWAAADAGSLDLTVVDTIEVRQGGEGWIQTYGAYAGDLNDDGYSDLMLPNEQAADVRVFLNDGAGGYADFVVVPIPGGSVPSTNEGADFNADGMIDFAVGNAGGNLLSVFMGNGSGDVMHDANYDVGQSVRGICVLDLDGDGDADMVTASRVGSGDGDVAVLTNDGAGAFTVVQTMNLDTSGETACSAADANGDGITDVFVGSLGSEVIALLNDGAGTLTESSRTGSGGGTWMLAVGDVDGDGNVDVGSADFSGNSMSILRGDGAGGLADREVYDAGLSPLAIDFGDIDGDGDLDAITSNLDSADYSLFENDGGTFITPPRTLSAQAAGSCAIVHDRDNDGDADVTAIDEFDDLIYLYDNPGP